MWRHSVIRTRALSAILAALLATSLAGCGDDEQSTKPKRTDDGILAMPFKGSTVELPDRPIAIASGEGAVWATSMAGGVVTKIDPKTRQPIGEKPTITGGEAPYAIDVAFGKVWVANFNSDQIVRIDPDTRKVIDRIDVDNRPFGLADGYGYMWVTSIRRQTVSRLDPQTGERVGKPIKTSGIPYQIAAGEGFIWVTNIRDGVVDKIDPKTGQLVGEPIKAGSFPAAIAVAGGYVWVVNVRGDDGFGESKNRDGSLWRIDPKSGKRVGASISVPTRPQAIAADDNDVWVISVDVDTLLHVDTKTGKRDATPVLIGNAPTGITLAPAGGTPGPWVAVSKDDVAARFDPRLR
ncbi:MAG: YncE family protein [Solirubrobacterales bacterium]